MGTRKGPNHSPPDNLSPDFKKSSTIPNILGVVLTLFLKRKSADLKKKRERGKKKRGKKKKQGVWESKQQILIAYFKFLRMLFMP